MVKHKLYVANFETYISKILKQVHPETNITANAKSQLNSLLNVIGNAIAQKAVDLSYIADKKTLSVREIQTAVRIILPGELVKHAVSEGTKAVTKYDGAKRRKVKGTLASKAGIVVPPVRARKIIERYTRLKIGELSSIYLAAVLEYLAAEVLELAGNAARDNRKKTVSSRHIMLAIRNDEELNKLVNEASWEVLGGGVLPNIHAKLLPKKKKRK
jgi:histone H2A